MSNPKAKGKRAAKQSPITVEQSPTHDLVLLFADSEMEQLVTVLVRDRLRALGVRPITFTPIRHPEHDPGCVHCPDRLLAPFVGSHRHAVVMFDREGCGQEESTRDELERTVEAMLSRNGWGDRARAIVIDPELEKWIWSRSPHVAKALGWDGGTKSLHEWLLAGKWIEDPEQQKPTRPKEAVQAVRKKVKGRLSGAVYAEIAAKASVNRCEDPAFHKFRDTLRLWFPIPADD